MNFVFISPNFPDTYWNFCARLRANGACVLGVGDCPREALSPELTSSIDEYYRVDSLEDYDQVFRAVAYLSFRHGKIDWIESNNEYWLGLDARLREDFHVTTGFTPREIARHQSKFQMKASYAKAGVPAPACRRVTTAAEVRRAAIELGGLPLFAKPEVGVGAEGTYRLDDETDLERFATEKPAVPYALEQFVEGDIVSYDAIVDSKGRPLFESSCTFPPSMAEVVEKRLDMTYQVLPEVPEQLRERGRAAVRGFRVRSRFVHLEFFRLAKPHANLGKKGDFVALEANLRPAGGYTPDMMNIAHATDVYRLWADMVTSDKRLLPDSGDHRYCVFASTRDGRTYRHSRDEVLDAYGPVLHMRGRMPDALANDLGNDYYVARLDDEAAALAFVAFVQERV